MTFSESELETIYMARIAIGSLELVCISAILLVFCCLKELHFFSMRLVIYMILADALRAIAMILYSGNHVLCYMQAVLVEFSALSSIIWTLNILSLIHI